MQNYAQAQDTPEEKSVTSGINSIVNPGSTKSSPAESLKHGFGPAPWERLKDAKMQELELRKSFWVVFSLDGLLAGRSHSPDHRMLVDMSLLGFPLTFRIFQQYYHTRSIFSGSTSIIDNRSAK